VVAWWTVGVNVNQHGNDATSFGSAVRFMYRKSGLGVNVWNGIMNGEWYHAYHVMEQRECCRTNECGYRTHHNGVSTSSVTNVANVGNNANGTHVVAAVRHERSHQRRMGTAAARSGRPATFGRKNGSGNK